MKSKIKFFLVLISAFSLIFQPGFVTAGTPEAITYLQSQSQDPWITMALAASGQSGISTNHLTSVSGTLATDYAKVILALASVNENPATFGNIDYVAKLKTYSQQNQMGEPDLINDDMWSVLALASVGETSSQEVIDAKNYILANQNSDGGFGYSVGGQSDTNDTAAAIIVLVEAGVSPSDPVIIDALAYLKSCQNGDGGVGYQAGNNSDSGSDSWVISALNKAGISPESWSRGENNPLSHLKSLQADDGGFWWVQEGTSDWNNKAMTAFAVIALSGKSYPIGYFQAEEDDLNPGEYHLRIEGLNNTICNDYVYGDTALDIIESGAEICNYNYLITQESFGSYLREINGQQAQGMSGWLYFINNVSLPVGAADYDLKESDDVLWYFGQWGLMPSKITISDTQIDLGQSVTANALYFDGQSWQPLANANIKVNNTDYSADSNGQLNLTLDENGVYQIYIETQGYIRSQKETVTVGDTISQNVGLVVEINQGGDGLIAGESIALEVNPSQIDFGSLKPGESTSKIATLTNEGTVSLNISASVSGDNIFTQNLTINNGIPSLYSQSLVSDQSKNAEITLNIPKNYLLSGIKNGELIFWATALE